VARKPEQPLSEGVLHRWRLIEDFRERLQRVLAPVKGGHPSWVHPERLLLSGDYLSLFLFGLLNPVVRSMRALCQASHLERVQKEVCSRPISLGSFSEAQHLLDPALLEKVFADLATEVHGSRTPDRRLQLRDWMAHDGTLWRALPRMSWALYGGGRAGDSRAVKLHLSFHVLEDKPVRGTVRRGKDCERAVWRESWQPGDAYIGDRYFGEDYGLLGKLGQRHCAYVLRLREQAAITVEEELPLSEADRAAGVVRQGWARLGVRTRSERVRVVWVQAEGHELILVTNLPVEELPAELVSLLYRKRWQVELFFRWIKCILGCRHWLAESPEGVTLQVYLALIAALLLQLYTGRRPSKRLMELIQFYMLGVATLEELTAGLERERQRLEKAESKKN
jgi:DDE family transposase